MLEVFGSLFLVFVNGVVDGEDILWVQTLLDALVHVVINLAESLIHESLSQFADAVVVGDAAAVLEHGRSRPVLDIFVDVTYFFFWVLVVSNRKVNVNRCARFIQLCDTEAHKHVLAVLTVEFARLVNCFLDILA